MDNNVNHPENPDEDFIDDLENISSQVESALIGARLSCDIIDLILSTYLTPEIPMEPHEPGDPLIEVHSDGVRIRCNNLPRIAEDEPSADAAEAIGVEDTEEIAGAAGVAEEPPIPAYAAGLLDIPRSLPEFDDYMNWRCNDCEKYMVGFGVGALFLAFIILWHFLKHLAERQ